MGRELVRQLVAEACNVSICDLAAEGMAETVRLCEAAGLPQGLRVTTHIADVSDFAQMERFRAEVADRHATDRIHLLFNNAGIGGALSSGIPRSNRRLAKFVGAGLVGAQRLILERVRVRDRTLNQCEKHVPASLLEGRLVSAPPHHRAEIHLLQVNIDPGAAHLLCTDLGRFADAADIGRRYNDDLLAVVARFRQRVLCRGWRSSAANFLSATPELTLKLQRPCDAAVVRQSLYPGSDRRGLPWRHALPADRREEASRRRKANSRERQVRT